MTAKAAQTVPQYLAAVEDPAQLRTLIAAV